jgi:hypothetical protein
MNSPPSFDHLPAAADPRSRRDAEHPIEAQIRRNGQMKYRRTLTAQGTETVMPDGEVIVQEPALPAAARTPAG